MPPPRGIGGRLWAGIKRLVKPSEPARPEPPPQPPPEPPPPPPAQPPGSGGGGPPIENRMEREYRRVTGSMQDYPDWRDLYDTLLIDFDSEAERVRFFGEFLRAYYLTSKEPGSLPRHQFHLNTGLPEGKTFMDWDTWRELRRGTT